MGPIIQVLLWLVVVHNTMAENGLKHSHPTGFPWNCGVSAMINGLMGGMSFLYGGGDFRRTVGVAIAAGFDCDNQAATLAGLIGVMHGAKAIPYDLTHKCLRWQLSKHLARCNI